MGTNKKLDEIVEKLDEIAEKLKNGKKYEELSEEIDGFLHTGMVDRDLEVEEVYERNKGQVE